MVIPKTREEAKLIDSVFYCTEIPCRNGHVDKRYTNTGICYECKRNQSFRDYKNNKERISRTNKKSSIKNYEQRKESGKKWVKKNIEKSREIKKNYKIRNRERYLLQAREYSKRKRQDPFYRISHSMSKAVWAWLKGNKGFRHWEDIVGWKVEDLKFRLQSLFKSDMNWENYGSVWEIDHIKPKSLCISFEECWNLENLQPLYCSENRSKCNRWIG